MLFEQRMPGGHAGKRSTEWVARLSAVIAALNNEVTRLTDKKPTDAIKAARVPQKPSSVVPGRPVGSSERKISSGVGVRYQPGELEGGRRRATDPVWSLGVYRPWRSVTKPREPVLLLSSRWASPRVRPGRAARCASWHSVDSRWGSHSGRISTMRVGLSRPNRASERISAEMASLLP